MTVWSREVIAAVLLRVLDTVAPKELRVRGDAPVPHALGCLVQRALLTTKTTYQDYAKMCPALSETEWRRIVLFNDIRTDYADDSEAFARNDKALRDEIALLLAPPSPDDASDGAVGDPPLEAGRCVACGEFLNDYLKCPNCDTKS